MNYVPAENIFNYLPSAIRRGMNDDDTIISWCMQAYRRLNFKGVQFMRNISFLEVSSHSAILPTDYLDIHKVSILDEPDPTSLVTLYECADCEEDREENRENPCPLTHRYFLNSDFYRGNSWQLMNKVSALSDNFFCKSPALDCQPLYFIKDGSIYTSISTGLVALDYYSFMKDDEDRFLLPESPQVMWEYLSKHVERRYLQDRMYQDQGSGIDAARKRRDIQSMFQDARNAEVSFLNHWRGVLTLSNIRISNLNAIMSNRIVHSADVMRRHLSTNYAI